jgi:hypothetical protein
LKKMPATPGTLFRNGSAKSSTAATESNEPRVHVRPLAEADLEDAARWYDDEWAGLAERFFSDVDRTFARIRERPF